MSNKHLKFIDGDMIEYEVLPLVNCYDPALRQIMPPLDFEVVPGTKVSHALLSLMESLNHYNGVGLAANQVGLPYRMCAVSNDDNKIWGMINPVIIEKSENIVHTKEGCFSFPGLMLEIGRPEWVVVEFYAANGQKITHKFTGLPATVAQHEIDHLNGIVFTDLVSELKLEKAKKQAKKMIRRIKRQLATVTD